MLIEDGEVSLLLGQHPGQVGLLQGRDEGAEVQVGAENIRDCSHSRHDDFVNYLQPANGSVSLVEIRRDCALIG